MVQFIKHFVLNLSKEEVCLLGAWQPRQAGAFGGSCGPMFVLFCFVGKADPGSANVTTAAAL